MLSIKLEGKNSWLIVEIDRRQWNSIYCARMNLRGNQLSDSLCVKGLL